MAKILVVRLSAIGDVAMTIPVIYSVAKANPKDSFTILTQSFLTQVFINRPSNVDILGINTKTSEKNLLGFLRFAFTLVRFKYDKVIDLHNVLRTKILCNIFRLRFVPVYVLKKDREGRKLLTRKQNKELHSLRPITECYADVFRQAGFIFTNTFTTLYEKAEIKAVDIEKKGKWIGVAPFAKHKGKIYPLEQMEKVVEQVSKLENTTVFLFGGRGEEQECLAKWESKYEQVKSIAGHYSLDEELAIIRQLDLLLSMDSANMHFASLTGTRVLSVWGATSPLAGFYGYHQQLEDAIQLNLSCRPCSIFGQKECYRGDWMCLTLLKPEVIIDKVLKVLGDENCN